MDFTPKRGRFLCVCMSRRRCIKIGQQNKKHRKLAWSVCLLKWAICPSQISYHWASFNKGSISNFVTVPRRGSLSPCQYGTRSNRIIWRIKLNFIRTYGKLLGSYTGGGSANGVYFYMNSCKIRHISLYALLSKNIRLFYLGQKDFLQKIDSLLQNVRRALPFSAVSFGIFKMGEAYITHPPKWYKKLKHKSFTEKKIKALKYKKNDNSKQMFS